jgi:His/Glu/Gln/Arg/opine family amino acid ABC transporter permease subunit
MLDVLMANLPYLLRGAVITLALSITVVVLGSLLGFALGVTLAVGGRLLRVLIISYIFLLRGIPVLVVMLLGYYIVPALGSSSNAYVAVAVSQIVYVGAFAAEIMRSAIASVPP